MSDFLFLAVPNLEGMHVLWYIQIFGIAVVFGICLFFVIYFRLKYRRHHQLYRQVATFDQQSYELAKQLLYHKVQKASGKTKLLLFIEYLERFLTNAPYANIWELLVSQWFTHQETEEFQQVLYADGHLSTILETKIDQILAMKAD